MKGLLFTELLEMVEENFGYHTANNIIMQSTLASNGIYTNARVYHRREMNVLFDQLQRQTKLPFEQLAATFGQHLCRRILGSYPQHKTYINRVFMMIARQAATPVFEYRVTGEKSLSIVYDPQARAACLTDGMVKGYLEHLSKACGATETVLKDGKRKFEVNLAE